MPPFPTIAKKLPKIGKKREKSGRRGGKSVRKGKNQDCSFTLPLLTDSAGYAIDPAALLTVPD